MRRYTEFAEFNITSPVGSGLDRNPCPLGYNKRLLDKIYSESGGLVANFSNHREIQQLNCLANSGNFSLLFRNQFTDTIRADFTTEELQRSLQAIRTVGEVHVSIPDGYSNVICSQDYPRPVNITFLSEFGALPLLELFRDNILEYDAFGSVSIKRVQASSEVGLLECSGNGDCDEVSGECRCYPYYGTSDGAGNPGTRGDCGHHQIY